MTARAIRQWLRHQTYYDYRPEPNTVQVIEDPKVPDTWVVRFQDKNLGTTDLMFICGGETGTDQEILERCLEEIELDSWPPTFGSLKFF